VAIDLVRAVDVAHLVEYLEHVVLEDVDSLVSTRLQTLFDHVKCEEIGLVLDALSKQVKKNKYKFLFSRGARIQVL